MDFLELLQWWCVILLSRAWEQYSLEAWSIWVEQQRLGKEDEQPNDLCGWAAWVCGAMALSLFPSFFLSFFCFFFKQARAYTFLKQGYSFVWLELAMRCSMISPTLGLFYESQVCNIGVSFQVCSNSKEHQSVQLMQSSCFWASYVHVLLNRHL